MVEDAYVEIGRECRFAIHIPDRTGEDLDVHMVKEQITKKHKETGEVITVPNIRYIKNFQRSFWITKPTKRTYKDKREYTELDEVSEFKCTQSKLRDEVAKALGKQWSKDHLKLLAASPYLYGTDISSTSLIKKMYQDKWPDLLTKYTVAAFDIETDVVDGHEEPIMCSLIFQDKAYVAVDPRYVKGLADVHNRVQVAARKYISEYIDKHNLKIECYIAQDVPDMIKAVMSKAHEWKPDFLAIWNMDFDIPKILGALEKYGTDPRDVFCDPTVPKSMRICRYKQGPKKKVTASGKVIPINPAMQWHTLQLTASFYVIDSMCSYKHIRLGEQEESSYSLDSILKKHELGGKLKFEEAEAYTGLAWHQFMQTNHKIEYIIYNIFDSLSMLELDMLINDLSASLPAFSATSDFSNFKSQPKRIADALHFFALSKGYVMGTVASTPDEKEDVDTEIDMNDESSGDDDDEAEEVAVNHKTLSLKNWIITLPAHNSVLGLPLIEEDPTVRTNIRAFTYDSDEHCPLSQR
jgi:hypothetical protein